ncbi:MAG: alpha-L-glutamate ligase-like protein [Pseudomonadota bacterium]
MIGSILDLRRRGVMGLNERNVLLVNEFNPRRLIRLVNDKTVTKRLAAEAGIPTPELYGTISNAFDMRRLTDLISAPDGAVIKPANGAQGNGILVIAEKVQSGWRLASGRRLTYEDIKFHTNNILSGMHSLSGQPDTAMVEARVRFDDVFSDVSFQGVPDIRVIVLRGLPLVAMVRLPTAASDGKANLHKGGVGVGLDLATGLTQLGMQNGKMIDSHPDTAHALSGIQVPHWDEMLLMAARAYDVTGLGYLGADIVLDREKGPLLLELNARPGISIQIANRAGLKPHVDAALAADIEGLDASARVERAKAIYRDVVGEPGAPDAAEETAKSAAA